MAEPAEEAKEEEDEEEGDAEAVLVPEGELSANVSVYILCVHHPCRRFLTGPPDLHHRLLRWQR